jgi:Type VI secretion system/phage-baseplate injector OB domain
MSDCGEDGAGGGAQRFHGKYRGKVENNVDPLERGRLQVTVPSVPGLRLGWALPCTPYAGAGVGFYTMPPVDANVWVEFEGGDPNYPIWSGCFWEAGEVPAPPAIPLKKVFQTTSISMVLNDTPGEGGFSLTVKPPITEVEMSITIDAAGITLSCPTSTIKMTMESIGLTVPPGSQTITAENVTLTVPPSAVSMTAEQVEVTCPPSTATWTAEALALGIPASAITMSSEAILVDATTVSMTATVNMDPVVNVTGPVSVEGALSVTGGATVTGGTSLSGGTQMLGGLNVTGATQIEGAVTVVGVMTVDGAPVPLPI